MHVPDQKDLAALARVGRLDDPDRPVRLGEPVHPAHHAGILGRQDEGVREEVEHGAVQVAHPAEVAQQRVLLGDARRLGQVVHALLHASHRVLGHREAARPPE
eukprot:scaffold17456_cov106-Isochrysis_galbana.AAC.3